MNCPKCGGLISMETGVCESCNTYFIMEKEIDNMERITQKKKSKAVAILIAWLTTGLFSPLYLGNREEFMSRAMIYLRYLLMSIFLIGIPFLLMYAIKWTVRDIHAIVNETYRTEKGVKVRWK